MGTTVPLLMGDGLRRNAQKFPLKIAAKDKQRETTYGELNRRVNQLANGLVGLGVRKGDAVALSVGNCIEHLEIVFATAKIGAVVIPLDVKWKALELASVLTALAPRFFILQVDGAAEFEKGEDAQRSALDPIGVAFRRPDVQRRTRSAKRGGAFSSRR